MKKERSWLLQLAALPALLCGLLFGGCARDQLFIYVDTDAPVPSLVLAGERRPDRKAYSPDALVDTLRVDVHDGGGTLRDACEQTVADAAQWPVSFGMTPPPPGEQVYLRLRIFRGSLGNGKVPTKTPKVCGRQVAAGETPELTDPPAAATIDRLLALPAQLGRGIRSLHTTLRFGCIGVPASFLLRRSCMDLGKDGRVMYDRFDAESTFQDVNDAPPSKIGEAELAQVVDCKNDPNEKIRPAKAVCIKGGFTILGDPRTFPLLTGEDRPYPLLAAYLSPFWMDQTEFTIERFDAMLAAGDSKVTPPKEAVKQDPALFRIERYNCTYGTDYAPNPKYPMNCTPWETARKTCQYFGGDLPTEAQWEHAARGRGQGWAFAWGNQIPDFKDRCCRSSLSRLIWDINDGRDVLTKPPKAPDERCGEYRPAPVGQYRGEGCPDGGDISLDGVWDLTGNLVEFTRDEYHPYAERCGYGEGLTVDPVCSSTPGTIHVSRGGRFYGGLSTAGSALRHEALADFQQGFRCVYSGN